MKELHDRFTQLLKELMLREGYKEFDVERPSKNTPLHEPDFKVKNTKGETILGEVKLYRTANTPTGLAAVALRQLDQYLKSHKINKGILVSTAQFSKVFIDSVDFEGSRFQVWDYSKLVQLLRNHPDLEIEFTKIINELQPFQESKAKEVEQKNPQEWEEAKTKKVKTKASAAKKGHGEYITTITLRDGESVTREELLRRIIANAPKPRGKELQAKLKSTKSGRKKKADKEFEKVCLEILEYLFELDLANWDKQKETSQRLHRFDGIARISSKHEFWQTLQNHFHAKYVIFEYKNYKDQISQHEVYTTEKYLYLPAMRSLAIIISRMGMDDNAHAAARGALRESGKVILSLSIEDVCGLLQLKDEGKNPSDGMITILDKMLMQIER